jgi:hypothetical protein
MLVPSGNSDKLGMIIQLLVGNRRECPRTVAFQDHPDNGWIG